MLQIDINISFFISDRYFHIKFKFKIEYQKLSKYEKMIIKLIFGLEMDIKDIYL